jgi:hypothetical protein
LVFLRSSSAIENPAIHPDVAQRSGDGILQGATV